jgi:hypothetical protein
MPLPLPIHHRPSKVEPVAKRDKYSLHLHRGPPLPQDDGEERKSTPRWSERPTMHLSVGTYFPFFIKGPEERKALYRKKSIGSAQPPSPPPYIKPVTFRFCVP